MLENKNNELSDYKVFSFIIQNIFFKSAKKEYVSLDELMQYPVFVNLKIKREQVSRIILNQKGEGNLFEIILPDGGRTDALKVRILYHNYKMNIDTKILNDYFNDRNNPEKKKAYFDAVKVAQA